MASSFAPDGTLVFAELRAETSNDIGIVSMDDEHRVEWLLETEQSESHPNLSPDGRWLAYTSEESGQREVYARTFPNVDDGRWLVSRSGGVSPVWGADRSEVFYESGDGAMMVVVNDSESTFSPGNPTTLFDGLYRLGVNPYLFDVSPDGEQFLTIKDSVGDPSSVGQIILVQNWFEELMRLVPTE